MNNTLKLNNINSYMENHNMQNDEIINHPLFRLMMRSIQMIPEHGNIQGDILQTTFDEQEVKTKPTCNKFIESLEELYITEEDVKNTLSCSICQDEFGLNEQVLELPCEPNKHYFHVKNEKCEGILPWLSENNTCPMCRFGFPTPDKEDEEEEELPESLMETDNTNLTEGQMSGSGMTDGINNDNDDVVDMETNIERIIMQAITGRLQNIPEGQGGQGDQGSNGLPLIIPRILPLAHMIPMDTVRDGFSDREVDEALRRSLED